MSNSFKWVDMKKHVMYHEVIFNHYAPINPCIMCIHRGSCEGEQYAEAGSYCRNKQIIQEGVNAR